MTFATWSASHVFVDWDAAEVDLDSRSMTSYFEIPLRAYGHHTFAHMRPYVFADCAFVGIRMSLWSAFAQKGGEQLQ